MSTNIDAEAVQHYLEELKAGFTSRWIEVGGFPLHVRVSEKQALADAPAVVFVHGLGLSSTYLLPIANELAADYRVYLPDLPGFGQSGKPPHTLDVPQLGDALAAWMHAFGLEKAALLGNSFGCQIIVECMARHPEQVTRAILQGPTTPPAERSWFWQFVRWQQNDNPKPMGKIARQDYRACGIRRLLKTFQYSIRHRPEDLLPQISVPVLVVRGSNDPICRPEWVEEIVRRLPQGRLVEIPNVQHTLVWTASQQLARVCRPFLAQGKAGEMQSHADTQPAAHRSP
jgi:2-hydroxy-6-oxonona-2,4-dienedioate hydrolase